MRKPKKRQTNKQKQTPKTKQKTPHRTHENKNSELTM